MTNTAIIVAIIAALLSGLGGVFVSPYFYRRLENRRMKMDTARKLFGGRYNESSKEFIEAMNEIMFVFSDSQDVLTALQEFFTIVETPIQSRPPRAADESLLKLMKLMCRNLGIVPRNLPDAYYLRTFRTATFPPPVAPAR
jgi:hypothetical protein